jgi:hypothetical protein
VELIDARLCLSLLAGLGYATSVRVSLDSGSEGLIAVYLVREKTRRLFQRTPRGLADAAALVEAKSSEGRFWDLPEGERAG